MFGNGDKNVKTGRSEQLWSQRFKCLLVGKSESVLEFAGACSGVIEILCPRNFIAKCGSEATWFWVTKMSWGYKEIPGGFSSFCPFVFSCLAWPSPRALEFPLQLPFSWDLWLCWTVCAGWLQKAQAWSWVSLHLEIRGLYRKLPLMRCLAHLWDAEKALVWSSLAVRV